MRIDAYAARSAFDERRRDQPRVDQPARRARELLGGAADDLAQDHAGIAACAHHRGAGDRLDDLGPLRIPLGLLLEPLELGEDRAHRQRHVVAGVSVGDREHVQVVDLLAPLLQMRERDGDDAAEALDGRVGHLLAGIYLRANPRRAW